MRQYQFRLSVYLATVVITALVAASPRLIAWVARGSPPEYVYVELNGKMELIDARAWPMSSLNPKNRPIQLTYAAPTGGIAHWARSCSRPVRSGKLIGRFGVRN